MFNPLKMAGDLKGMEKMLQPALEKFMKESGFVKQAELEKLEQRVDELEKKLADLN
jgi:polyhydroxyalkanoate synthesis regulator phasin